MKKIENEYKPCYDENENGAKAYAIAPIEGLLPKTPEEYHGANADKLRRNCRESDIAAAVAKGEIDRIISELTAEEKEQLLIMMFAAGIPHIFFERPDTPALL